jgi:rhamnose utilization protein RhaD (predicted bifunctional aldolase and dehydrogenase)
MHSRWSDAEAARAVEIYGKAGVSPDVALRTYTTRLLGCDPLLVLHGGGNTSVKTEIADALGETHQVLCVKGSGWDMGTIEPAGLPAVKLAPLRRLRVRDRLSDEEMVNFQRVNLLDASAPNPSVETLLHAFPIAEVPGAMRLPARMPAMRCLSLPARIGRGPYAAPPWRGAALRWKAA